MAVCGCLWLSMAFEAASEKRLGESLKHLDTSWKHPKASWNVIKACFIEVLSYRHAQHTVFYRVSAIGVSPFHYRIHNVSHKMQTLA